MSAASAPGFKQPFSTSTGCTTRLFQVLAYAGTCFVAGNCAQSGDAVVHDSVRCVLVVFDGQGYRLLSVRVVVRACRTRQGAQDKSASEQGHASELPGSRSVAMAAPVVPVVWLATAGRVRHRMMPPGACAQQFPSRVCTATRGRPGPQAGDRPPRKTASAGSQLMSRRRLQKTRSKFQVRCSGFLIRWSFSCRN